MSTTPSGPGPEGDDLLPLSALNDLLYCNRRCWLHRVAGIDADNAYTLMGKFDHERADDPSVENRPGIRIERALPLVSRELGLIGRADIVEFRPPEPGRPQPGQSETHMLQTAGQDARALSVPYPVDYKHGPKRKFDNDDVQLCAQAMCLEEMLGVVVPAGAIFHATSKRRREVVFTDSLRQQVRRAALALHDLFRRTEAPPASIRPQCEGCSMHPHCLPEAAEAGPRIRASLEKLYEPDA